MRRTLLAAVAAVFLSGSAPAQPRETSWSATLRDALGAALPGAVVRIESKEFRTSTRTAADGRFAFEGLPPGDYSLSAEHDGRSAAAPLPLRFPAASAPVVVQWSGGGVLALLETSRDSAAGEQLSAKAVSALPLNKRDFSQLLLLAAGTMTDANGAANFTQQFAVNGQRGTAAVFAMDGVDISDPEMGGATFSNLNVDAVQEIQSSAGWMPAEIGRGAAGFTNIVTRSGTAAVHGSIFEFLRNAALDARNFFDRRSVGDPRRIPPFSRNEFGLTNGGPVSIPGLLNSRGRTFYFLEYQGFRQVLGSTQVIPVPTVAERAGRNTTAFAGDTLLVPVDPRIGAMLRRYPLPNDPQGPYGDRTYATSSRVATSSDQFSARLDHRISASSQLFGRFTWNNISGPTTNPSQTAIDSSFGVRYVDHQRNAALAWTATPSPNYTFESSVSFTRTTPSFPTPNRVDPALKFGDGLYEAFNNAAGSVVASYGNLFQVRQNFTWVRGRHTVKAGAEVRANRDTTLYGISPNGEYQFGGGTAYSPVYIPSASGAHDIHPGDPLPDALTGLLTASAFTYSVAVAPLMFAQGDRIGDSAVRRDAYNAYVQDSWKIAPRLVLNYGLRYEIASPIREGARRASAPVLLGRTGVLPGSALIVNPQPAYKVDRAGWGPRAAVEWRPSPNTLVRAGAGITTLLVNLWQDNALTGSNPFVAYPRLTAAPGQPIRFGMTITPHDLPAVYAPDGGLVFAAGDSRKVPANTLMDVLRFERDLAALSPDGRITPLSVSGISPDFQNGYIGSWTAALERKLPGVTVNAAYVGTAGVKLPAMDYPNGYSGAEPGFAPYTQFDSSGRVAGGYGPVSLITNRSHSSYHALQVSTQKDLSASGLGLQASYTFSRSLDDASAVLGGFVSGSSGAAALPNPQDPYHPGVDRGPSSFDITHALTFSVFQEIRGGWQVLAMGSLLSGSPFTVYSGMQQTGAGAGGADRPDQVDRPRLSTGRTVREDYFGRGEANASFFRIPAGRFGSLGRNTFRGPGMRNLDIALIKDTRLGGRAGAELATLQIRAEFFNVFNLVNFGLPSNIVLGPGFGQISRTASSSRQIQLALKLIY